MRTYRGMLVAFLTLCLVAVATPAAASCPPPQLAVAPGTAAAGSTVTLTGGGWASACVGTVVDPNASPQPTPARAAPDVVEVSFVQAGRSVLVATVMAAEDYTFAAQVRVPTFARPGAATFTAQGRGARGVASTEISITGTRDPVTALPRTGPLVHVLLLAVAGAALVVTGFATTVAARPPGRHARRR